MARIDEAKTPRIWSGVLGGVPELTTGDNVFNVHCVGGSPPLVKGGGVPCSESPQRLLRQHPVAVLRNPLLPFLFRVQ